MQALDEGEDVFRRAFDNREPITPAHRAQRLEQCANPGGRVHRFVVYEGAEPISYGAMTLFPALGFAMLWRGGTVPEARGRGAYRALLKERMRFADDKGIALVGLYAKLATSAPIVDALGFEGHGHMTFWDRSPA
jgi:GNAT superfamily N-acetyltransferase